MIYATITPRLYIIHTFTVGTHSSVWFILTCPGLQFIFILFIFTRDSTNVIQYLPNNRHGIIGNTQPSCDYICVNITLYMHTSRSSYEYLFEKQKKICQWPFLCIDKHLDRNMHRYRDWQGDVCKFGIQIRYSSISVVLRGGVMVMLRKTFDCIYVKRS